ncbi:MAG: fasciclin domain-containing protein, partial [Acidimicrobiia bacterium]
MSTPSRPTPVGSVSRYQRRILAWGGAMACLLYVVGAPIYLDRVERDLTERVTDELAAGGFDGVRVSFSGQTGSIDCSDPLGDPRAALELAYSVRGVRAIDDLPDECRVRTVPDDDQDASPDVVTTTAASDATEPTPPETAPSTSTSIPSADFATLLDVLDGNPQFSLLRQLVRDAGLGDELAGDGPLTLFAPTDAAFDALSPDAVAQLRSDPELLERVLGHHLVDGSWPVAALVTGPLTTVMGDELVVDVSDDGRTVGGVEIAEADVLAMNGVVHAIDALLVPDDVDLNAPAELASATATFSEGGFTLQGVVRSEVERSILVLAASASVGVGNVVDELLVDPDVGLDEANARSLASLIEAVAASLTEGTATFDGTSWIVTGTYASDEQRAAVERAADAVGATVELTALPPATDDDAAELEAELNAYVAANPILFEP